MDNLLKDHRCPGCGLGTWVLGLPFVSTEMRLAFRSPALNMTQLVGAVGIEPTTFGLKGRCSTTELRP